jgi:hypothetical protein
MREGYSNGSDRSTQKAVPGLLDPAELDPGATLIRVGPLERLAGRRSHDGLGRVGRDAQHGVWWPFETLETALRARGNPGVTGTAPRKGGISRRLRDGSSEELGLPPELPEQPHYAWIRRLET